VLLFLQDATPHSNLASSILEIKKVKLRKFQQGAVSQFNLALPSKTMLCPANLVTSQEDNSSTTELSQNWRSYQLLMSVMNSISALKAYEETNELF
jgi:hypothetical protein